MPLQKLQFRPGVNREGTTLANEGGWFAGDKIRFRSGQVEKIGGWVTDSGTVAVTNTQYLGICRSLYNWASLTGSNYLSIATNEKVYIQNSQGGTLNDITPYRYVSSNTATFSASAGSNVVTVTDPAYGGQTGDFVVFTGAQSLGGNVTAAILNYTPGYQITYISTSQYTITIPVQANGSDTGNGGNLTVASYELTVGNQIYQYGLGWGAGAWGGSVLGATTTTLTANANATQNTFAVTSTTGFASSGTIVIGNESVAYSGTNATAFTGLTRGYQNTVAASYTTGTLLSNAATYTGWGNAAPSSQGIGQQMRLWSQDNFGQNLVLNPRGGALYYWVVSASGSTYYPAQVLSHTNTNSQDGQQYWYADADCPTICNYVVVSDSSRFVIAFGVNDYGSSAQNPMLVRWSDQENILTWAPSVTNQAGSYLLSQGSQIITAVQGRQEIVVFTDSAVYSMQYLGAPYVWGFQILTNNITIIGPNAAIVVNGITYWMGQNKFYMYSGQVQTLPCTLRAFIFDNINLQQGFQVFAGLNEKYNEIWWFYCSANSTVVDSYVIYNYLEQVWMYGSMTRTAWIESSIRGNPIAAGYAPVTTLTQSATANATTLHIASQTTFPSTGTVLIDQEEIYYTGANATTLTGCARGYNGTDASSHNAGAVVTDIGTVDSAIIYHENGNDDGTVNPAAPIYAYAQSADFDIGDGESFGFVWRIIPDVTFDGSSVNNPSVTFTTAPRQNPGSDYGSTNVPSIASTQNYVGASYYDVQQFTQYAYVRCRGRQMAFAISSNGVGVAWQLGNPRLEIRPDGRR